MIFNVFIGYDAKFVFSAGTNKFFSSTVEGVYSNTSFSPSKTPGKHWVIVSLIAPELHDMYRVYIAVEEKYYPIFLTLYDHVNYLHDAQIRFSFNEKDLVVGSPASIWKLPQRIQYYKPFSEELVKSLVKTFPTFKDSYEVKDSYSMKDIDFILNKIANYRGISTDELTVEIVTSYVKTNYRKDAIDDGFKDNLGGILDYIKLNF